MKLINTRKETVEFSRNIGGNRSVDLCKMECNILTVETEGFKADGFSSAEYYLDGMLREVVVVNERLFAVGHSTCGKREFLSVTLPPGLDPRPEPREWDVRVSNNDRGDQVIWDTRIGAEILNAKIIRVREIINEQTP